MLERRCVGILGAGLMGRQIARVHAAHGIPVRLFDTNPRQLEQALAWIREAACDRPDLEALSDRIHPAQSLDEASACELIIESVVEDTRLKQDVLAAAEAAAGPQVLLASNTSSIPLAELGRKLKCRERFCALHFCHPISERPLVEVVASDGTAGTTITIVVEHVRALGLSPLIAPDRPGFLLNRLLNPYLNRAVDLLERGGDLHSIESAALELGMPVGPFTFLDRIGIDTAVRVGGNLYRTQSSRLQPVGLPVALYKAGHLGEKRGAGFFQYDAGEPPPINPFVDEWLRHSGSVDPRLPHLPIAELRDLLWTTLTSEVALAVRDGAAPADAWQALALGVGWRRPFAQGAHGRRQPRPLMRNAAQSPAP